MLNQLTKLISTIYFPFLYRKKKLKMGVMVNISNVHFGNNNYIGSFSNILYSSLGDYTYLNKYCQITHAQTGKFCSIADNVKIGLASHPTNLVSTHPAFFSKNKKLNFFSETTLIDQYKETKIGNDVWIGANAIVLGGVNIGDGAIIAAGSIVTKNIEPYSIVAGCPARLIKYRFESEIIDKLLEKKWWDNDVRTIKNNYKKFLNLDEFFQMPDYSAEHLQA
jgi:acetyltransferase-like isoleucine patch superfamily enzyme